jgi:hypothetical protein
LLEFLPKCQRNYFKDFCPEFCCSFLGAFWKLCGLPGDLVSNIIINNEAYRKPLGRYKKFQGRNPGNDFVGILEETIISLGHYKIK